MVNPDQQVFQKVHPHEYVRRFLSKDVRPDGRALSSARKLHMTPSSIGTSVGSAMIKLGKTTVVAGVSATLVQPPAGDPERGSLEVIVELVSTASPNYKAGRTSDEAVCLSEYVRGLISPHVNLVDLCVEPGLLVWNLRLTVYCLDNDGNLEDSTLLAAVGALMDVMLPNVKLIDDDESNPKGDDVDMADASDGTTIEMQSSSVIAEASIDRPNSLEFETYPIPVSFAIFEGKALLDPSLDEEAVSESKITFLFRPNGELRGVLKPGGKQISENMYLSCLAEAKSRSSFLVKQLESR